MIIMSPQDIREGKKRDDSQEAVNLEISVEVNQRMIIKVAHSTTTKVTRQNVKRAIRIFVKQPGF